MLSVYTFVYHLLNVYLSLKLVTFFTVSYMLTNRQLPFLQLYCLLAFLNNAS